MSTIFPKWSNKLPPLILAGVLGAGSAAVGGVWYYATPKFWRVGYMPTQPGAGFSHQIHAGKLGLDCRYCHSHVEESPEANIPSVSTCIGCHADGHVSDAFARTPNVQFIRDAWTNDQPVEWRRIHKVPDYVRNFPHNVHVNAGVSCFSCHGNIMEQQVVHQVEPLSMSWCLDCHRDPTPHLVPKDKVTDLYWVRNMLETTQAAGQRNGPLQGNTAHGAIDTGTPGGAALLGNLQDKGLHLLPENCAACHY